MGTFDELILRQRLAALAAQGVFVGTSSRKYPGTKMPTVTARLAVTGRTSVLASLLMLVACSTRQPPRVEHARPVAASRGATAAEISAVVRDRDNQAALRGCYERVLKTAGRALSARVDVTVFVSRSGAVQRVAFEMPSRLNAMAPCVRTAISRWTFPANTMDYETQFPLVLQSSH